MTRRHLRYGMVGGGQGAFIGAVHRSGAAVDGTISLVCGALSSSAEKAKASGAALGLAPERSYSSYKEMMEKEAALPDDERMDFVAVVTPNHVHLPVAKAAMEAGFPVISDKPMTGTLADAIALGKVVKKTGKAFGLTHAYLGYPLVQEARRMVAEGHLGRIRKIYVEYPQGWLAQKLEDDPDAKQAGWRTDPSKSGDSGCFGDIGTHAHSLAEYVSGQRMTRLAGELNTFVQGRALDDDGAALFHMDGGAKGVITASQICVGELNGLRIRIYGDLGGLSWVQENPNELIFKKIDGSHHVFAAGANNPLLYDSTRALFRMPAGHPEGLIEAFANIYMGFADAVAQDKDVVEVSMETFGCPGLEEGLRGMAFVDAMVKSSKAGAAWVDIPSPAELLGR